jgi:hypothetical protein
VWFLASLILCTQALAADLSVGSTPARPEVFRGGSLFRLQHSGIDTANLRIAGRPLHAGVDYSLNPSSGLVTLARPLGPTETLVVSYTYRPVNDTAANGLLLNFTGGTGGVNLRTFLVGGSGISGNSVQGAGGQEIFGLEAAKSFGAGSQVRGTFYSGGGMDSLMNRFQLTGDSRSKLVSQLFGAKEQAKEDPKTIVDLQGTSLKGLGGEFNFRYTDVGKGLDLAPLKAQSLTDDQKTQLALYEKTKGMKSWQLGSAFQPKGIGKLGMNMQSYTDGNASASQQTFSFEGKAFKAGADFLSIDAKMARLKDTPLAALGDPKNLLGHRQQRMFFEVAPMSGLSFGGNFRKDEIIGKAGSTSHTDLSMAYKAPSLGSAEKPNGLNLSFLRNDDVSNPGSGSVNQKTTDHMELSYLTTGGSTFSALQETTSSKDGNGTVKTGVTRLGFDSGSKGPTTYSLGMETQRLGGSSTRSSQRFALASNLPKGLFFSTLFERGVQRDGDKSTSFGTTQLDFHTSDKGRGFLALGYEDVVSPNGDKHTVSKLNASSKFGKTTSFATLWEGGQAREGGKSFGVSRLGIKLAMDDKKPNFFNLDTLVEDQGLGRGKSTTKFQLAAVPTKWFSLKASEDGTVVRTADKVVANYKKLFHAESDPKLPFTFVIDRQDEAKDSNRKMLQTRLLTGHFGKSLTLTSTGISKVDPNKSWERTEDLAFQWQAPAGLRLAGNFTSGSSDKTRAFAQSQLKLEGGQEKEIAWDASYRNTTNSDGLDRTDLAGNVTATVGKATKVTAALADISNGSTSLQKTQTIKVVQPFSDTQIGFEVGTAKFEKQGGYITNGVTFGTPSASKSRVRFNTTYRNYAGPSGEQMLAYNHAMSYKPTDKVTIELAGYRSPDSLDGKGQKVVPMAGESLKLAATLNKALKLDMGFAHEKVVGALNHTLAWNLGLEGSLGAVEQLQFLLASRISPQWKKELPTRYLKLVYKRELNEQNSIAFSTEAKIWRDSDPSTKDQQEVVGRVDWVRSF